MLKEIISTFGTTNTPALQYILKDLKNIISSKEWKLSEIEKKSCQKDIDLIEGFFELNERTFGKN